MADMLAPPIAAKEEVCTPGIFRLPPELRIEIFLALFNPGYPNDAPDQTQVHHVGPRPEDRLRYVGEERERTRSCYALISTCRQIHAEVSSLFWSLLCVDLHVEPKHFIPGSIDPYDLKKLGPWIARSGIRSMDNRRKITCLSFRAWSPDPCKCWDETLREDTWWREDLESSPSVAGLDGFENVKTINIEMVHPDATFWSSFPSVAKMQQIEINLTGAKQEAAANLIVSIRAFKKSTYLTSGYLLSKLPKVNKIILSGYTEPQKAGLTWHGIRLQPLEESSDFVMHVKSIAEDFDSGVEIRKVDFGSHDCYLCYGRWDSKHWTPQNPKGPCEEKVVPTSAQTADYEDGDLHYSMWEDTEHPIPDNGAYVEPVT
ncbi:hypothetical protein LTS10_010318 [Elasticomyces elasticus]|nr:hypothetical protein LTS10_010318 [Elasticomyces elasticus]